MQNEISYSQNENDYEPEASPNRRRRHTSAIGHQDPPRPSTESLEPALHIETSGTDNSKLAAMPFAEPELALFSLISDPQTIAGGTPSASDSPSESHKAKDSADLELERLRQALHAREQELAALRSQSPTDQGEETAPSFLPEPALASATRNEPNEPEHPAARNLLDSAQAHHMAHEAKRSEQASRRALHTAQQEQRKESVEEWPSRGDVMALRGDRSAYEQSWETRPLSVQKHLLETAPGVAARSGILPDERTHPSPLGVTSNVPSPQSAFDVRLRATRAEVRELEATLSLARDTALTQKLEIARLRSQLEESSESTAVEMAALEDAFRSVLPVEESIDVEALRIEAQNALRAELAQESEAAQQEIERLRSRLALGDQESEAREAERRILKETLAARETELQNLRLELSQTTLSLREESDLVQELDASLATEREHNAETQALLDQLRNALQQAPPEDAPEPRRDMAEQLRSRPRATETFELVATLDTHVKGPSVRIMTPPAVAQNRSPRPEQTELAGLRENSSKTVPIASGRLFDAWQDDQVRRHFGPFGIDTSRDLVMAPLHRRNSSLEHPAKILVLGSHTDSWTERLAEDLIGSESPPFEILRSTDAASARRASLQDRPIDEFITSTRRPDSPADLEALLAETRPSVIVSRNFLSDASDVGPWLDVLRQLPRMGPAIVLFESTGIGPVSPSDALIELGDRIWSLMPARYTRADAQTDQRLESWQEAFHQIQPLPSNGLRAALRDGFDLEISAQFGFLAEPFLRSRIAENFDPEAQRDRRFLHQIADLDDRKIEAGLAPALHFVARIDGRIDDPHSAT